MFSVVGEVFLLKVWFCCCWEVLCYGDEFMELLAWFLVLGLNTIQDELLTYASHPSIDSSSCRTLHWSVAHRQSWHTLFCFSEVLCICGWKLNCPTCGSLILWWSSHTSAISRSWAVYRSVVSLATWLQLLINYLSYKTYNGQKCFWSASKIL